ncbi:oligosaccharide flippase family protein [Clostridium perfringens]|nr:lipopolysaccharide biosynthesis protein [Clostridium perfringens]
MKNNNNLKAKTISGLFWSFSNLILNQGIQFIIQIFLARLLMPKEFGLIGMITVFIAISNSIVDSGFKNALVREDNPTKEDYSTVFYFNLLTSIILYIILYILSPRISTFFGQPELKSILRVLALTLIINSFGIIQRTILIRNINFKIQTSINITSSIISGGIAIFLAYKGFGVWSLVFRTLIMQTIQSVLLTFCNNWKPMLVFNINSFKKLFDFGWKLLVSGLIDTLYNNLYYLVIGRFYSATDLGYYTNAQKFRDTLATSISGSVQSVTYPALSSIKNDHVKLRDVYKKIIKISVYINFPVMIGLAAIAKPLILVLFGENWSNSIVYFQILCIGGMLYPLHAINLNILQVRGRSDLFLKLEIIKKIIGVSLCIMAIVSGWGIIGLIWMLAISSFISFIINSYYSKDIINYSTFDQIKDISLMFLITILMFTITYFSGEILLCPNIIKLIVQICIGILSYIILSLIFKIQEFFEILKLVKKFSKK